MKNINLLEQRKKNFETNKGEIDVRHSFRKLMKTMDYHSSRGDYSNRSIQRGNSMNFSNNSSHYNSYDHSQQRENQSNRPSLRFRHEIGMENQLNSYLNNSPSSKFILLPYRARKENSKNESGVSKKICLKAQKYQFL